MKVKEIKNHQLDGTSQTLLIEYKTFCLKSIFHPGKVLQAKIELSFIKVHYRIHKQSQLSFHAVVGLWRAMLNKTFVDINYFYPEVVRELHVCHQLTFTHNQKILPGNSKMFAIEVKLAISFQT